jgi:hypothetical protein
MDFHPTEIDERAFALFLMDGVRYFLDQDPPLRRMSIIDYCQRLWNRWTTMSDDEKAPFRDRAYDELRRLRRFHRADIYRMVMRDDITPEDGNRRRNRLN